MFRYVCHNEDCRCTFISKYLRESNLCPCCNFTLLSEISEHSIEYDSYHPKETIEELKIQYVELKRRRFSTGINQEEGTTIGRAVRKLSFECRKGLLKENGLWDDNEDNIYKVILDKDGLYREVLDKNRMYYRNRKRNKLKKDIF